MELKPMYATGTIRVEENIKQITLESKIIKDPTNTIPNGIYKVIHWEKWRQWFISAMVLVAIIASIVMICLYATVLPVSWVGFVLPIISLSIASYKLVVTLFEMAWLKRNVKRYKQDIKIGLTSTPPFISKLYMSLHKKQVGHNWTTVFVIFYLGLITLILWGLKDISWWIFDFQTWIKDIFSNPDAMVYLFSGVLIITAVIQVVLTIQRKKRIDEIEAYFGGQLASEADIVAVKVARNKYYRRLFIISLMILLLIPIIIKTVIRMLSFRK